MKGKLSTRIWLIAGFLFVGVLLLMRENLSRDVSDFLQTLSITKENFLYQITPQRCYPFTTILEKEITLKTTFGEPFISFSRQEWQDLWQVIYGIYEPDASGNPRLPAKARQLNIPEIEEELMRMYPDFFGRFSQAHWKEFWKILKIKK